MTTCGLGRPGDEERHTSRQGLAGIVCAASSSPILTPEARHWLWQVSIQNGLSGSLISQNFLPKGDTNRRFGRTLRHKRFFGASDTTADQRAGGIFIFEDENRATFLPQRRGASAKVVLACAQK